MSSPSPVARYDGRNLPVFDSLNNIPSQVSDRAESSVSGSRRSENEESQDSPVVDVRDSLSSFRTSIGDIQNIQDTVPPSRRRSHRSSGGFLLDPISRPSPQLRTFLSRTNYDRKGKRRSEESELSVPKRQLRNSHAQTSSPVGSSPLATEVKHDTIPWEDAGSRDFVPGTDVRHSSMRQPDGRALHKTPEQPVQSKRLPTSRVGYDTDPSQIVNMALSLSEGRRRQASSKRHTSGDQRGNRPVSAAVINTSQVSPPSTSVAQYVTPRRQVSGIAAPTIRPETTQYSGPSNITSPTMPIQDEEQDIVMEDVGEDELSRATQARVQKAKTFFELAYEHRRLISHLPPIRYLTSQTKLADHAGSSKVYNPLQYIRNRKLRVWDKTAIDAEADGWHDIVKVRSWVDIVLQSHQDTRHDPDECVRLPPLSKSSSNAGESDPGAPKTKTVARAGDQQSTKPRRPRSDWETHPGDMIADCFWLEQGMNKVKIQDKDNNQIYPSDTHFRFSGWRNRTPMDVPAIIQSPTPPPDDPDEPSEEKLIHSPLPELPVFRSTAREKQGRRKDKKKNQDRDERKGLKMFIDDSETPSSSSERDSDKDSRGRKRFSRRRQKVNDPKTADLHRDHSPRGSFSPYRTSFSDKSQPSSAHNSARPSLEISRISRLLKRESSKDGSSQTRSKVRGHSLHGERTGRERNFENDYPRSSFENDSTAPNSPSGVRWPSIAINLESPGPSRSPSPMKKPRPSSLNPFRERLNNGHEKVATTDFASADSHRSSGNVSSDNDRKLDSSTDLSRGTSPMTRGLSPMVRDESPTSKSRAQSTQFEPVYPSADHRASTVSRVSTRTNGSAGDHSRIRGIFKGGRIAELVGNEVSRVGDYIWKRDIPHAHKTHGSISDESIRSYDSDHDGQTHPNGHLYKNPPVSDLPRSRSSTLSSIRSEKVSPPAGRDNLDSGDKIKYHNPNLPTFTSPFQDDKDRRERNRGLLMPNGSTLPDHISNMASQHRSASKSPRMESLALPKLNTTQPSRPDGMTRVHSYGFGSGLDLRKSQDASEKFNSAINSSLQPGTAGLRTSRSAGDLSRPTETSRKVSVQEYTEAAVTRRDITRAEALILSSAIKAREIGRRADAPRTQAPKYLRQTITADNTNLHTMELSQIRRREEHIFAARNVMGTLSSHATQFNTSLKTFSGTIAPSLYTELQNLEDLIENKMTPRVRITADEAGELSMKLTTTSTLAVKDVNDAIDGAFRRKRRGPIRWVKAAFYLSMEWAVVALLWAIWAVVTFIRLFLAISHGVSIGLRWLFWLD